MHASPEADSKPPQPIVIDAFEFKHDREGYLSPASRTHLYLFDVRSGACEALTADFGRRESHPAWSPDGEQIAYVSDPMEGPEQTGIDEIDLIPARAGATPRQLLTSWSPNTQRLAWSPDGTRLAFLQGAEAKFNAYIMDTLATLDVKSGEVRVLTERLDRAVLSPAFAADGRSLELAVEDDGTQYPARIPLAGGAIERLGGPMVVHELAAVDYAVASGLADPARLGVGGWSYGGLLTDYLIASDPRFKAAISGAGSGNQLSTYGTDQYIVEYNAELGAPWRNPALWLKV